MAPNAAAGADTFPKLLIRNAHVYGARPAMRHKDLGIWQTWTWARGARRSCAPMPSACIGSASSAARPSPSSAPTGRSSTGRSWRRRCSAPFRCRSMPTRSPTSWPMCSPTPRCASPRSRTRSRSTRSCRSRSACRSSNRWSTTRRAGLRDYDHSRLHSIDDVIEEGRKALADDPQSRAWLDGEIAAGKGSRSVDHSLYLGHHRRVQGRGADRRALDPCGGRHGRLRQARPRTTWRSPICRSPGSATIISITRKAWSPASAWPARKAPTPRWQDLREIGPTFYFAPPRTLENAAHARDDPHGGCRLPQAQAVPLFHRRGAALWRDDPQRPAGAARRAAALRARQSPGLRPAQERARLLARARRLYRGRGDRAGAVHVLSLARPQPEAALRPDRSLPLRHRAAGRRNLFRHRRPGLPERRHPHRRERRGACSSRPACSPAISRTTARPPRR